MKFLPLAILVCTLAFSSAYAKTCPDLFLGKGGVTKEDAADVQLAAAIDKAKAEGG